MDGATGLMQGEADCFVYGKHKHDEHTRARPASQVRLATQDFSQFKAPSLSSTCFIQLTPFLSRT
jgi:hypothetical protein